MTHQTLRSAIWLVTAMAATTMLTGCGTSRAVVTVQEATEITKGQELLDLQRARTEGAIDASEYERLRKVLMSRPR